MKRLLFLLLFILLFPPFAHALPNEDCAEYYEYGLPSTEGTRLCRTGYLIGHGIEIKTPAWVMERPTRERAFAKMPRRSSFISYLELEEEEQAELPQEEENVMGGP